MARADARGDGSGNGNDAFHTTERQSMNSVQWKQNVSREHEPRLPSAGGQRSEWIVPRDMSMYDFDPISSHEASQLHCSRKIERITHRELYDVRDREFNQFIFHRRRGPERSEHLMPAIRESVCQVDHMPLATANLAC